MRLSQNRTRTFQWWRNSIESEWDKYGLLLFTVMSAVIRTHTHWSCDAERPRFQFHYDCVLIRICCINWFLRNKINGKNKQRRERKSFTLFKLSCKRYGRRDYCNRKITASTSFSLAIDICVWLTGTIAPIAHWPHRHVDWRWKLCVALIVVNFSKVKRRFRAISRERRPLRVSPLWVTVTTTALEVGR